MNTDKQNQPMTSDPDRERRLKKEASIIEDLRAARRRLWETEKQVAALHGLVVEKAAEAVRTHKRIAELERIVVEIALDEPKDLRAIYGDNMLDALRRTAVSESPKSMGMAEGGIVARESDEEIDKRIAAEARLQGVPRERLVTEG